MVSTNGHNFDTLGYCTDNSADVSVPLEGLPVVNGQESSTSSASCVTIHPGGGHYDAVAVAIAEAPPSGTSVVPHLLPPCVFENHLQWRKTPASEKPPPQQKPATCHGEVQFGEAVIRAVYVWADLLTRTCPFFFMVTCLRTLL